MTQTPAIARMLRLTQQAPEDIDAVLAPYDPRTPRFGGDIAPCARESPLPPCALAVADQFVIATRVRSVLADPADVAYRLTALATQHAVEVVVFSDLDYSGLERFGFRTERVAGATEEERSACVAQLRSFWGVELMI